MKKYGPFCYFARTLVLGEKKEHHFSDGKVGIEGSQSKFQNIVMCFFARKNIIIH